MAFNAPSKGVAGPLTSEYVHNSTLEPINQTSLLFSLPQEIRDRIWVYLFDNNCPKSLDDDAASSPANLRARPVTLRPQKSHHAADLRPLGRSSDGNFCSAILMTCQRLNYEARSCWERLPKVYRTPAVPHSRGYLALRRLPWLNLRDITLTLLVHGAILKSVDLVPLVGATGVERMVHEFAKLMSYPELKLQRLNVVLTPARRQPSGRYLQKRTSVRVGTAVILDAWALMKPLACLPECVQVRTPAQWELVNDNVWLEDWGSQRNASAEYSSLYEDGFVAMRKAYAGTALLPSDEKMEVPGYSAEDGKSVKVGIKKRILYSK